MKNDNIKLPAWIALESEIIERKDLNNTDKVLYALICALSNNSKKKCFTHNNYFSKVLAKSPRQVQRSLNKLQNAGLIKISLDNGYNRFITTSVNAFLEFRQEKTKIMRALNQELSEYNWLEDIES